MSDKFKMQYHTPSANGGKLFINAMEAVKKMFAENKVHFELTIADWEENEKLKKQLEIAKEALDKNVKTIGNFMDRLSVEGIGNPDISTARLGTIEALHCFKRSRSALEQIERGNDE